MLSAKKISTSELAVNKKMLKILAVVSISFFVHCVKISRGNPLSNLMGFFLEEILAFSSKTHPVFKK